MSEDRRSQSARDTAPEPPEGDDALRHVRWDKRLEAARARRAQVLSEKRARGEDEGQTLISRRPWEDEAAGVLPTDLPQRQMRKAPPGAGAKGVAMPVRPASGAQTSPSKAPPTARPAAPVPVREARVDPAPVADERPRRRVGLIAAFAVGGLVAAGALVVGTGWMPPAATGPDSAAGVVPEVVTQAEEPLDALPAASSQPDVAQGTDPDRAAPVDAGPVEAGPDEVEVAAVAESAPTPEPDPIPEAIADPIPEPVAEAAVDLAAPQAIDLAALSAIALPEAPVGEGSDLALATGAIGGETRAPRSPAPPPLMSPADPVLAGLGVRAQRQAPAMPLRRRWSGARLPQSTLAPRAVAGSMPSTAAPRLELPEVPDRPAAGGNAAPGAVLAAVAAPAAPDAATAAPEAAPVVPQGPTDAVLRLAAAAPRIAPPFEGAAPGIDLTPPAPPRPTAPPAASAEAAPVTGTPPEILPEVLPDSESPVAAAEGIAVPEEPEPAPSAPPRADAVLVHVLVPADGAAQTAETLSEAVAALGYTRREPAPVSITIRQTQVRFYHPEDAEAAQLVAETVGGPARDFTAFRPSPPEGTIEVWIEGEAPPPPAAGARACAGSGAGRSAASTATAGVLLSGRAGHARGAARADRRRALRLAVMAL